MNKLYRADDIRKKLSAMGFHPLDVMIVGGTGAGKSSTLNTILEAALAEVGTGCDPKTMEVKSYRLSDDFRLWDSPGLGDGYQNDAVHGKKIIDKLNQSFSPEGSNENYGLVDLVLVVLDGSGRDMGTAYQILNNVIVPNFPKKRIMVAINQADIAMKGRHWNDYSNQPDYILKQFLDQKAIDIQRRIKESTGVSIDLPVYYSASKNYNVHALLDMIVDHIPAHIRRMGDNVHNCA